MSESCNNCKPGSDGHRYMNTREGLSELTLGQGETLNPSKNGLVSGSPVKSPNLRKMDETEPSNEGSDILTKIQLANQRAEEFLNNLEFEDDYYDESTE